jgi:hypothetical protein
MAGTSFTGPGHLEGAPGKNPVGTRSKQIVSGLTCPEVDAKGWLERRSPSRRSGGCSPLGRGGTRLGTSLTVVR